MKHAKKMMLVEIPKDNADFTKNLSSQSSFLQDFIIPKTAYNLDQELRQTLNRDDLSDHDKWLLYNQSLQRFLFLLDEERKKKNNPFHNIKSFNNSPLPTSHSTIRTHIGPSNNINSNRSEVPLIRNPIQGLEKFDRMELPDTINNVYNRNKNAGHFDIYDDNHYQRFKRQKTNPDEYEQALSQPLPISNDTSSDEDIGEEEVRDKAIKRHSVETPGIKAKQYKREPKPIFSYLHAPPLQRWLIDLNTKQNAKRSRDLINFQSTIQKHSDDVMMSPIVENMEVSEEKNTRKRKHEKDDEDIIPKKVPYVSLPRLPYPLTMRQINQLINKFNTNRVNIERWEELPRMLRSNTKKTLKKV